MKKTKFDYTQIKSFKDACKKEGVDPDHLPEVSMIPEDLRKALIAVYKLFIIFKAINDGWEPDWNNRSQYKYYPWQWIEASKELSSGFGFSSSSYGYTYLYTDVGSRLCTDSSEKAVYVAKQFQEEYKEFFLITK